MVVPLQHASSESAVFYLVYVDCFMNTEHTTSAKDREDWRPRKDQLTRSYEHAANLSEHWRGDREDWVVPALMSREGLR